MYQILRNKVATILFVLLSAPMSAHAAPPTPTTVPANNAAAPSSLIILFDLNSSKIREQDKAILDKASRAFNEGKPTIMLLVGNTDTSGRAKANLLLSQRRASAVLQGLLDRGIPADRFQLVAKGQTEPPVSTQDGVREAGNRRVVISWH